MELEVESVATHVERLGNGFDVEDVMQAALEVAGKGDCDLDRWV